MFVMSALTLVLMGQCAAAQLKVLVLDSKTGKPLGRKDVCVSLSTSPNMTALDHPEFGPICHKTDSEGSASITLPEGSHAWAYVTLRTNDLLPCFAPGHAFSVAELATMGIITPNTCGTASTNPLIQAGELVLFAHQMTFSEVLKAMGKEL